MTKRAVLFAILGAVTGGVLGAVSVGALIEVTRASAYGSDDIVQRAALLWGVLGAIHGLVLFFCSLGETPVIEDTRAERFVVSSLADNFDYRRFGHRILYITAVFGLVIAFVIASLLAQGDGLEVKSLGTRLLAGFGISCGWTVASMLVDIVIVSKAALS